MDLCSLRPNDGPTWSHLTEFQNEDKIQVVNVMGKAFGEQYDDPDGLFYVDAGMLFPKDHSKHTIVIKIKYIYKVIDLKGEEKIMEAVVGYMLFSSEMKILRHGKRKEKNLHYNHPEKMLDVCSLVQFGILDEYKGHNLGGIVFQHVH